MAESDPELALLERLRAGDASALDPLLERYAPRIYRLVRTITRNDADAEEVVQDVLLTLVQKHQTFEGRSRLGTWIYRIATNAALNKRRGRRAEVEVPIEDWLPTFQADGHRAGVHALLVADWSQDPERTLLSREAGPPSTSSWTGCPSTTGRSSSFATSRSSPMRRRRRRWGNRWLR